MPEPFRCGLSLEAALSVQGTIVAAGIRRTAHCATETNEIRVERMTLPGRDERFHGDICPFRALASGGKPQSRAKAMDMCVDGEYIASEREQEYACSGLGTHPVQSGELLYDPAI